MNYFNKLPVITYNNNSAVNIMARAKLSDNVKGDRQALLPYTLEDGDRMDAVAQAYYGSPGYAWLVWFSNETVDPYYDMPLSDIDFDEYMKSKYGSIEIAQRKIAFYKINSDLDSERERTLSTSEYNNLTGGLQKYWTPRLDYLLNVRDYIRNQDTQTINTNRIASLTIANVQGTFKIGEEIQQTGTIYGFATFISSTQLTLQHMNGNFTAGASIVGKESGATASIVSSNNAVAVTQAFTDIAFWRPVTVYEHELDMNDSKREILLVDSKYRNQIEQDLKRTMDPQ